MQPSVAPIQKGIEKRGGNILMGARSFLALSQLVPEQERDILDGFGHCADGFMQIGIGGSLGHLEVYDLGSVALGYSVIDLGSLHIFRKIDSLCEKKIKDLAAI